MSEEIDKKRYQCDRSGFMYEKLYKQYEYVGNRKVWTGLMVGKDQLDELTEPDPLPKNDPQPVKNARPFKLGRMIE